MPVILGTWMYLQMGLDAYIDICRCSVCYRLPFRPALTLVMLMSNNAELVSFSCLNGNRLPGLTSLQMSVPRVDSVCRLLHYFLRLHSKLWLIRRKIESLRQFADRYVQVYMSLGDYQSIQRADKWISAATSVPSLIIFLSTSKVSRNFHE